MKYVFGGFCGVMGIIGCFVVAQVMAFNAMFYMLPKLIPTSSTIRNDEALVIPKSKLQNANYQLQPARGVQ